LPFTREHAEAAIRFIEEQEYAWVIDAGRFVGHVRFHSMDRRDKLPIPMKPPLCSEMIAPPVSGMISPPV